MISLLGNRPVIQIGRHQIAHYGSDWLADALRRAATAASHEDFPFIEEIRDGVFHYLETRCPLRLLPAADLVDRVRRMLVEIGCRPIADQLAPFAPPVSVQLLDFAKQAGTGFELGFFESLRAEISELQRDGAAEIHFHGHDEAVLWLVGAAKWNRRCDVLLAEIRDFLARHSADPARLPSGSLA